MTVDGRGNERGWIGRREGEERARETEKERESTLYKYCTSRW